MVYKNKYKIIIQNKNHIKNRYKIKIISLIIIFLVLWIIYLLIIIFLYYDYCHKVKKMDKNIYWFFIWLLFFDSIIFDYGNEYVMNIYVIVFNKIW